MKITYETTIVTLCPANGERDIYTVTIESGARINCEDIRQIIEPYRGVKAFQEDLTDRIASHFDATVTVTTRGTHSGVLTTVTCGS